MNKDNTFSITVILCLIVLLSLFGYKFFKSLELLELYQIESALQNELIDKLKSKTNAVSIDTVNVIDLSDYLNLTIVKDPRLIDDMQIKYIGNNRYLIKHNLVNKIFYKDSKPITFLYKIDCYMTDDSILYFPEYANEFINFSISDYIFSMRFDRIQIEHKDTTMLIQKTFDVLKIRNNKLYSSLDGVNWVEL